MLQILIFYPNICSGSNDHTTKFWCRNRPADNPRDVLNMQNQGLSYSIFSILESDFFSRHRNRKGVGSAIILCPCPYEL